MTKSSAAGRPIPIQEVMEKLTRHIAHRLEIDLVPGWLLPEELSRAEELYQGKYSRPDWTFRPQPAHSSLLSTKTVSGVLTLAVDLVVLC